MVTSISGGVCYSLSFLGPSVTTSMTDDRLKMEEDRKKTSTTEEKNRQFQMVGEVLVLDGR